MMLGALRAQDFIDRLDDRLTASALDHTLRARLSGTLDLEGYDVQQPAPSLIHIDHGQLFNPRLSVFLDAQYGANIYFYAQARADRGFDPSNGGLRTRLDEYALRFAPTGRRALIFQVGKFATVVGSWTRRHGSWDSAFVTAPLVYENLTGVWDVAPPKTSDILLGWAGVRPQPSRGGAFLDKPFDLPVIWGPSYATGAAVFGEVGHFNYAVEVKNAALASRPRSWSLDEIDFDQPAWSARVGWRPNAMWHVGMSASTGVFLYPDAATLLNSGTGLRDYRQTVIGQDIAFAWHHVQAWSEVFVSRFELPRIGNVDTIAYYLETKWKLTPQFFLGARWNQQLFSKLPDRTGASVRWGREATRFDLGPGYRFTPHLQLKVQYSLQHEVADLDDTGRTIATQLTLRF